MTVERLSAEMPYPEFIGWIALSEIRAEERKKADRMAGKGMRQR